MKIALIGYGKMGKEIEKIARNRSHTINLIIDIDNQQDFNSENLQKCDVAIDFSIPSSAYNNIIKCIDSGTPIVSGTTGWHNKLNEVSEYCKKKNGTFFYATNYSLGVNIFFNVNKHLAAIMNKFDSYNVRMDETHHTEKLDAPSGTAITLAEGILNNFKRKNKWVLDENEEIKPDELAIKAHRIEAVPGIHEIKYDSEVDYITIKHSAKNRRGFALGAVLAAEYIHDKKGIFSMNDLLGI